MACNNSLTLQQREREREQIIISNLCEKYNIDTLSLDQNNFSGKRGYFGLFSDNKQLFLNPNSAIFWFTNRTFSYLLPEESG